MSAKASTFQLMQSVCYISSINWWKCLPLSQTQAHGRVRHSSLLHHWQTVACKTVNLLTLQVADITDHCTAKCQRNYCIVSQVHYTIIIARCTLDCKARYCDRMSSVCLSVCLSVTLVDCVHIGWNSSLFFHWLQTRDFDWLWILILC